MTEATSASPSPPTTSARIYGWPSGARLQRLPTEAATLSLTQLARHCGIDESDLLDLVDHGVLRPADSEQQPWHFSADCIGNLRRAQRLRQDLALDDHGFALMLMCLDRICGLEAGLHRLRSELRHLGSLD